MKVTWIDEFMWTVGAALGITSYVIVFKLRKQIKELRKRLEDENR